MELKITKEAVTMHETAVNTTLEQPIAVSYTHLDVYKRQVYRNMPLSMKR